MPVVAAGSKPAKYSATVLEQSVSLHHTSALNLAQAVPRGKYGNVVAFGVGVCLLWFVSASININDICFLFLLVININGM